MKFKGRNCVRISVQSKSVLLNPSWTIVRYLIGRASPEIGSNFRMDVTARKLCSANIQHYAIHQCHNVTYWLHFELTRQRKYLYNNTLVCPYNFSFMSAFHLSPAHFTVTRYQPSIIYYRYLHLLFINRIHNHLIY